MSIDTYKNREQRNYVYRIWDVDNNCYWLSPSGKRQWNEAAHAKSSWNCARSYIRDNDGNRMKWNDFEETSRGFVIHKFRLQRVY